jgi:uncharacterized protein (TIGR02466 family)
MFMDTTTLYDLTINHTINKLLAKQLLPIAKTLLADPNQITNMWGYKNTYTQNEGASLNPQLEFFTKFILEKSYSYLQDKNIKLQDNVKLWVSLFASEIIKGDEHTAHNHPGALLSGLIYLQVPTNSSKLEFFNPRCANKAWRGFVDKKSYIADNGFYKINEDFTVSIQPTPGLFLFWESWANHRVPINEVDGKRITFVFNVGAEYV